MHFRFPSLSFRLRRPPGKPSTAPQPVSNSDNDNYVIEIQPEHSGLSEDPDDVLPSSILLPLPPDGHTHRRATRSTGIVFDPKVEAYMQCKARGYPRIPTFTIDQPSPWEIIPPRQPAHFSRSYHVIYERDGVPVLQDEFYRSLITVMMGDDGPTLTDELILAQELVLLSSSSSASINSHAEGLVSPLVSSVSLPTLSPAASRTSLVRLPPSASTPFKTSRLNSSFSTMDMNDLVEAVAGLSISASFDSTGEFALGLVMSSSGTYDSLLARERSLVREMRTLSV